MINFLQTLKDWQNTAVVIAYDDSDGWYDHQMGPIVNQSATAMDALLGAGSCGNADTALPGVNTSHAQGRCGYGPRLPLMVISPYAKKNFVDHTVTDQSSILRFIEDNWLAGQRIAGSFVPARAGRVDQYVRLRSDGPRTGQVGAEHEHRRTSVSVGLVAGLDGQGAGDFSRTLLSFAGCTKLRMRWVNDFAAQVFGTSRTVGSRVDAGENGTGCDCSFATGGARSAKPDAVGGCASTARGAAQ